MGMQMRYFILYPDGKVAYYKAIPCTGIDGQGCRGQCPTRNVGGKCSGWNRVLDDFKGNFRIEADTELNRDTTGIITITTKRKWESGPRDDFAQPIPETRVWKLDAGGVHA